MANEDPTTALFRELEEQLIRPDLRSSTETVARLLADDFVEIGSSGRVYDKRQAIEALREAAAEGRSPAWRADSFALRALASDVVLITYRALGTSRSGEEIPTLRSSIWQLIDGRWQMIFHQGTPASPPA